MSTTLLTNKALLVTLAISQWNGRRFDRRATNELTLHHGVADGAARVNKSLLPKATSLDAVHKMTNAIRWDFYERTLPWAQEGVSIIRADSYLDFASRMREHMFSWREAVREFIAEYPQLREDARVMLNGLYKEEDYPHPSQLEDKFKIGVTFLPVPSARDWRVSLADEEMDELRKEIVKKVTEGQAVAMQGAWERVYKVVKAAHERLSNPAAIFRDSLIDNAKDLCRIMPSLNLADDPDMERMRNEIEGALCAHNPSTLREDPGVRKTTADKMADIMKQMGAFYVAPE